jgi:choice-of-anchor B domain-containing protein
MSTWRSALRIAAAIVLAGTPAAAGPTFNVIFHAHLDQHTSYNDIWGYTAPNGDEYALLGCTDGLSVVNVTDPDNPYETGFLPGAVSTWRDIKTYGHYAYVTNETSGGIAIVDLANPESPVAAGAYTAGGFSTAHNLYIDTSTARLYTAGSNLGVGGTRILSLANPTSPVQVGSWETEYLHDVMVQHDRLYGSAIYAGVLYVLNVANPASIPAPLGTASGYPSAFTHNAWVTADDAYVMTTDELSSASCRMWDLATLPTLQQTAAYKPNATTIPHNTHIDGDYAYISHYTLGVKIVDVSDPYNLVEVGAYDTYPANDGSTYDGCWGVFPFFQTNPNLLVASDIGTGLYVLEFRGPLGTVTGEVTRAGNPSIKVAGATLEVLQDGVSAVTDATGHYTLQDVEGTYDVSVSAFGYQTTTVPATFVVGTPTTLNIALDLLPSGSVSGVVTDAGTSLPVPGAEVALLATPLVAATDGNGEYVHDPVPAGSYTVRVRAFGYATTEAQVDVAAGQGSTLDFPLTPALVATSFEVPDLGWTVSGNASLGAWERADPEPTFDGGTPMQPGDDHTPSPGTQCWVTGPLAGSTVGAYDVDGGETILTSPSFALADAQDPHVAYWKWYAAGVVSNPTVDPWTVRVSTNGGGTWVNLENTSQSTNAWVLVDIPLRSFVIPTNLTRFQFTARDTGSGSVIEAALDDFMIYDVPAQPTTAPVAAPGARDGLELGPSFPNPFRRGETVSATFLVPAPARVVADVQDVAGRRVAVLVDQRLEAGSHRLVWDGRTREGRECAAGVYFLRLRAGAEERTSKILRIR